MKSVLGYIRVSTEEQAKSGLSIENQERKISGYADLHDLNLETIISDAGKSAKDFKRDGIQQIISGIKSGKIGTVIIYKLDRLTRNLADLNGFISLCNKYDVSLCSISDHLDTKSANGRMIINLLGTIAQWEREVIGERTSEALQELKRQGKTTGNIPFGFSADPDGNLIENQTEQEILNLISELKVKGYTYKQIADELNRDGYRTRRGTNWNINSVYKIGRAA